MTTNLNILIPIGLINLLSLNYILTDNRNYRQLPDVQISDSEIVSFVDDLRRFDDKKARPSQIRLDYQGHTNTRDENDNAKSKLFKHVDESIFSSDSTYAKLIALHDNYIFETGKPEVDTNQEKEEINKFLDAVMQTRLFRFFRDFLREKGHPIAESESTFRQWIYQLWFGQYSRARGAKDTCGFEHVFLGEAKNGELSGMHNWVRFYLLEKNSTANHFDYKGFLVKRFNIFAALKYSVGKYIKRSGSFLIGTSPEFDMALYTFCFLTRRGHTRTCNFEFDGCPVSITSFDLIQENRVFIGSMYPSAGRITGKCRQIASRNN